MKWRRDHELVEYHEPTFRGVLSLLAAIVLGVAAVWLGLSWLLNQQPSVNASPPAQVQQ